MDPHAAWQEIVDALNRHPLHETPEDELEPLHCKVEGLRNWLKGGGFMPARTGGLGFVGLATVLEVLETRIIEVMCQNDEL